MENRTANAAPGCGRRSGSVALAAVLRRLAEQLGLQGENVIEHPIDSPALEAMIGYDTRALEVLSEGQSKRTVNPRLTADLGLLQQQQAPVEG